jgi:uncharacterized membrane protein YhhN
VTGNLRGTLLLLALAVAIVDWIALAREHPRWDVVLKPLVLALVLASALTVRGDWRVATFQAALGLSLYGDILLLMDASWALTIGGGAFLGAHLCYTAGLNQGLFARLEPEPVLALLGAALIIALVAGRQLQMRSAHLRSEIGQRQANFVRWYLAALTLTLLSAWGTFLRPGWTGTQRALVVTGASLFFVADYTLLWRRFVAPDRRLRLISRVAYHLAQLALAASL